MTIKVSDDGNAVCCGRNGPRLAFQKGGVCGDCCLEYKPRLCLFVDCCPRGKDGKLHLGNFQEVKS
jgi:hypothetical protein